MADALVPDHKLCGFLCAVLKVASPSSPYNLHQALAFGSPCYLFSDGPDTGFKSESNIVLSLIDLNFKSKSAQNTNECGTLEGETESMEEYSPEKRKSPEIPEITPQNLKKSGRGGKKTTSGRKRVRSIGMVNGSISVVRQLHALVSQRCLKMISRVVRVETGENQEARAVLLVDVYLPLAVFYGCQFPRSQAVAAAFFQHLSCDWGLRSSILDGENYWEEAHGRIKSIWNLSHCHVLGCKLPHSGPDSPKRRLFELHEIFKSLPSIGNKQMLDSSRVFPSASGSGSGIWDLSDDILINVLNTLGSMDLARVASTCRHLRSLASLIMPCMKLKLFPHQQAAVEWMLHRERDAEVLPHPLYKKFCTEDGFCFYLNTVSGDIVIGEAPTVKDFRGGMFCDEPGLGKTITALSLILKTQGTMADPPDGVQVIWCTHNGNEKGAYYESTGDRFTSKSMLSGKRILSPSSRRKQFSLDDFVSLQGSKCSSRKTCRLMDSGDQTTEPGNSPFDLGIKTPFPAYSKPEVRCTQSLCSVRKNLLHAYDGVSEASGGFEGMGVKTTERGKKFHSRNLRQVPLEERDALAYGRKRKATAAFNVLDETWVQCDACCKWRRILDTSVDDGIAVWFCSMNTDPAHQSCKDPQEPYDSCQAIKYLQGFFTKGTPGGKDQNVSFFTSVLREYKSSMDSKMKKALTWLANLCQEKLSEMEAIGLPSPLLGSCVGLDAHGFQKIFQAFGLIRRVVKGVTRWYYPKNLDNLEFDLPALRVALCEPLDTFRLYLSKATLVVVPANLVEHWKMQIQRHVRPDQLRLVIWTDHKKPSAHSLAWDYDVVITTFSRLSAEWGPRKKSPLMQVHWFRVMLDEGHTLGSSLSLSNKLQMAVSLTASNRWLLTGTPTPNTPSGQLSHLQPLLKFLHEEVYGENPKLWEAGIVRPFEAEREEGRSRLLQLLQRCMISARKKDLQTIPPCIKKTTYLNFTQEHAGSYNELVETVRRNILMADWNDASHVESLLNPRQWKFRCATIRNVRLSCCVAGHIKVTNAGQDIQETLDILIGNGLDPSSEEYCSIKDSLLCGGNCLRCKEWCRLPVITPCRHLLCLDCVALDRERCTFPGCGYLYEMQTPETLARPENPNPKWPVPKDLIELQPSYKQDDWNPDWQSTSSSKVCYLVKRLKMLQDANREISLFNEGGNANQKEKQFSLSNLSHSSTFFYGFGVGSRTALPLKVLIFSQFLEHIHVIEQQLTIAGIKFAGMYSPMHSAHKMKSLVMFQLDSNCMALVMDGSAALGLDLSFVTHVFLMEPIWDKSMEEQVISRAHRMGATRPIQVETLAMCGTIEEQMVKFLQDADNGTRLWKEEYENKPKTETRCRRTLHDFAESDYLAHLSFVRTEAAKA